MSTTFLVLVCDVDDLLAAVAHFFNNAAVGLLAYAEGCPGNEPFACAVAVHRAYGHVAHLLVHRAYGDGEGLLRPDDGLFRLRVDFFSVLLQEPSLHQEGEDVADFFGRDVFLAFLGDVARARPRHHRCKFTDDGVFPGFIVLECVRIYDAYPVLAGDALHLEQGRLLVAVLCSVSVGNHLPEVFCLEPGKPHGLCDRGNLDLGEFALAHAHELEEVRRGEPGKLAELAPRECPMTFAVFIIVLQVGVVVLVFEYRLHAYKVGLFLPKVNICAIQKCLKLKKNSKKIKLK